MVKRMAIAMSFAMLVGVACGYNASLECAVTCTTASDCPSGLSCSNGLCRSTGATCERDASSDGPAILDGGVDARVDGSVDGGSAPCPAVFGGARHLFVNMLMDWPAAEAYCKSLDSTPTVAPYVHLVVVNDLTEFGQLTPTGTPMEDAWLGYTDSKLNTGGSPDPAKFLWVTDEQPQPGFARWNTATSEPDETSGPRCAYKNFWVRLFRDALDGRSFDHLTSLRCGRDGGSGFGIARSA